MGAAMRTSEPAADLSIHSAPSLPPARRIVIPYNRGVRKRDRPWPDMVPDGHGPGGILGEFEKLTCPDLETMRPGAWQFVPGSRDPKGLGTDLALGQGILSLVTPTGIEPVFQP